MIEFAVQSFPTEEYRWVVIHPHRGALFFSTQFERDLYAEEAATALGNDTNLYLLCCAEVDALFVRTRGLH